MERATPAGRYVGNMSLRFVLTLSFSLLTLLIVVAGSAWIAITTLLHGAAENLQAEMGGARSEDLPGY